TPLRAALRDAAAQTGIQPHLVPHQLRHTYATSMLRAGVSMPALMKLLGHRTANMTLRYVEITQKDLQREFHLARQSPRHLIPLPASLPAPESELATRLLSSNASPLPFAYWTSIASRTPPPVPINPCSFSCPPPP